jgi:hypothetical protein
MARRQPRSNLIQRLVSPAATRIRRRVRRARRQFSPIPLRWSFARRELAPQPVALRTDRRTDRRTPS